MGTDLERRRQAIVAALRRVMSEPLPSHRTPAPPVVHLPPVEMPEPAATPTPISTPAPVSPPEPAPFVEAPPVLVIPDIEPVPELDEPATVAEAPTEPDDGISVPPLEPIGSMSRAASRALFGD